jgi:hypothetical protein
MKTKLILSLIASAISAQATSITFSAAVSDSLRGVGGVLLEDTDVVEVGLWDGATFSAYSPAADLTVNFGAENGFFSQTIAAFNSNSDTNGQLAIQWSNSGQTGLIFTNGAEWLLKGGDGTGSDFNENLIDVNDATGGTFVNATYDAGALNVLGGGTFSLVPEPSTYAALAGLCALGAVMVRRRRS